MIYDKRLAFKIFLYIILILTINLLSNGQITNIDEEDIDIPYQNANEDMTMVTDITKHNNFIYKRHAVKDHEKKKNSEEVANDSSSDLESEFVSTNNETLVESEENSENKNSTVPDSDEYQNNNLEGSDIENQDSLENFEDLEKNEDGNKTVLKHSLNREKRVNKAGSSHKNRPSLNRVTSTKNKDIMCKLLPLLLLALLIFQVSFIQVVISDQNDLSNLRHLLYAPYNDKLRIGDSFDNMDYNSLLYWNQLSKMKAPYARNIRNILNSPHLLITTKRFRNIDDNKK
ncbi:Hypothetical protein SRAE_X000008600 [Strongyloides ratti]|uniref:Uncharacterized protein n=1 Tax=Strongyloides ratti TaxID=34506 RepID=A0A090LLS4_STRRB|nr:Hypothetical protein SRAE_X000008600 [Strongyloides ratti]CEF70755.1 Hypothetical protein SRAE_X000008600 [Strongyloides ratti]